MSGIEPSQNPMTRKYTDPKSTAGVLLSGHAIKLCSMCISLSL